ncbi:MAG: ricin-type beta-trefoil lectin domain protein [Pseudomonadota bacterium]
MTIRILGRTGLKPVIAVFVLCLGHTATQAAGPMDARLSADGGYEGRIRLTRFLDEPDGYCMDVPGPVGSRMKEIPLLAHTCHADPLGDQRFEFNTLGEGRIRWTGEPEDLCFEALALEANSKLDLKACAGKTHQSFVYTDRGEFRLVDTSLCIHVEKTGPGLGETAGEGQDPYGRGRSVNAQFTHLMRFLELRSCGTEDPAMSRWRAID